MKAIPRIIASVVAGLALAASVMRADPVPNMVFVVNQSDSSVSLVDLNTMKELRTIHVGYNPYFVAVSGDQKTLAVDVEGEERVKFYDTRTLQLKGECRIGKMYAEHMVNFPDGKRCMMANRFGNALLIINYETMNIEQKIENVDAPHNIRLGAKNQYMFASSKMNPGVSVVDLERRRVERFVPMKYVPRALASSPDDRYFYCGGNWVCGIFVYETATGKLEKFIQTPLPGNKTAVEENTYHGIESVNDSIVIATCEGMNALDVINVKTGALVSRNESTSMPGALMAWPGRPGWYVFTNMLASTVQTFRLTSDYRIELGPSVKCGTGRIQLPKRFCYYWGPLAQG